MEECPFDFYECLKCGHIDNYSDESEDKPIYCRKCGQELAGPAW